MTRRFACVRPCGSYRDDITAIVVNLPFLEAEWPDEDEDDEEPREENIDEQARV